MRDLKNLEQGGKSRLKLEADTDYLFLKEDIDYLFCPTCRVHVPCQRLATGGWEVMCQGCLIR